MKLNELVSEVERLQEQNEKALQSVDGVDYREGHFRDNATPSELRYIILGLALKQDEWSYDGLCTILRDELPLTMTLGLLEILVTRMVKERMFTEPVEGLLAAVKSITKRAAEAAGGES